MSLPVKDSPLDSAIVATNSLPPKYVEKLPATNKDPDGPWFSMVARKRMNGRYGVFRIFQASFAFLSMVMYIGTNYVIDEQTWYYWSWLLLLPLTSVIYHLVQLCHPKARGTKSGCFDGGSDMAFALFYCFHGLGQFLIYFEYYKIKATDALFGLLIFQLTCDAVLALTYFLFIVDIWCCNFVSWDKPFDCCCCEMTDFDESTDAQLAVMSIQMAHMSSFIV